MSGSRFPSRDDLQLGLTSVFSGHATFAGPVEIIERRPLNTTQSHPSEVVKCRTAEGRQLQLLCKCAQGAPVEHHLHGHRRGVAYEAMVYRTLLAPQAAQVPQWHGMFPDQEGRTWLVIEYLDGAVRISRAKPGGWKASLAKAAQWIARFHNSVDARPGSGAEKSLIRYDAQYYAGWASRTLDFAEPLTGPAPWLAAVVDRFTTSLVPLLVRHPTIIHGEYYPGNIVLWRDAVYVLDWESAAIGAGGIDLSCLIEGLEPDTAQGVIDAYRREREQWETAAEFMVALDAATIYLQFRWLGDRREWTIDDASEWRFDMLREAAERCGLV